MSFSSAAATAHVEATTKVAAHFQILTLSKVIVVPVGAQVTRANICAGASVPAMTQISGEFKVRGMSQTGAARGALARFGGFVQAAAGTLPREPSTIGIMREIERPV